MLQDKRTWNSRGALKNKWETDWVGIRLNFVVGLVLKSPLWARSREGDEDLGPIISWVPPITFLNSFSPPPYWNSYMQQACNCPGKFLCRNWLELLNHGSEYFCEYFKCYRWDVGLFNAIKFCWWLTKVRVSLMFTFVLDFLLVILWGWEGFSLFF